MAIGYSFALIGTIKFVALYISNRLYGILIGLTLFMGYLGASFSGYPLSYLIKVTSYNTSFNSIGAFGMIILIFLFISTLKIKDSKDKKKSLKATIHQSINVLKDRNMIILTLYTGIVFSAAVCIADLWGKLYLSEVYGFSKVTAGFVTTTLIYLGISFGSPIWGVLHSIFNLGKKTLIFSSLSVTVLVVIFFLYPFHSKTLLMIIAFLIGILSSNKVVAYALSRQLVAYKNLAVAVAMLSASVTLMGSVSQLLSGVANSIAEHIFGEQAVALNYSIAVAMLPLLLLLSTLIVSFLKIENTKDSFK